MGRMSLGGTEREVERGTATETSDGVDTGTGAGDVIRSVRGRTITSTTTTGTMAPRSGGSVAGAGVWTTNGIGSGRSVENGRGMEDEEEGAVRSMGSIAGRHLGEGERAREMLGRTGQAKLRGGSRTTCTPTVMRGIRTEVATVEEVLTSWRGKHPSFVIFLHMRVQRLIQVHTAGDNKEK